MDRPIERLRVATRTIHETLETLPYARAVLDGTVTLTSYRSFLRAMHLLQLALEQVVETSGRAELRELLGDPGARRVLLERDLAQLAIDPYGVDAAALSALVLSQRMRLVAERDCDQLLGFLYVFEGSQLGGLVQHAALAGRPEFAHGGLEYLRGAGKGARANFEHFGARLDEALASESALESATLGAQTAFEGFAAILMALDPHTHEAAWPVNELNHEAGRHAIPEDLREVQAALWAGEQTYRTFSYYAARYGERGLRFTRSDSAWLATLAREDAQRASKHVHWVARVLAARGMPRMLLELHLGVLHAKLTRSVPERAASYATLAACAAELRHERMDAMPIARSEALAAAFRDAQQAEQGIEPAEAGALLLAAVADERCNVPGAVESLVTWLADPQRFSSQWVAAVRRTLASARAAR